MRTVPRAVGLTAAILMSAVASGCTSDSGSETAFCDAVTQVPALESVLARFNEADPDLLQDRIDKARGAYEDLARAAPSEIDAEADDVVDVVDQILLAVEENPTDPAKAADQLRTAMADHPEIDRSRAKVTAYAQTECGVRLEPTLGTSTTSTSSASAPETSEVPETTEVSPPEAPSGG